MRDGFSVKELAALLRVHPNSVAATIDPALRKVAVLIEDDAVKFWQSLEPFILELRAEREREHCSRLARANEGRLDTTELSGRDLRRGAARFREQPATEGRPFAERGSDERATTRRS